MIESLLMLCCCCAQADTPQQSEMKQTVARLVRQLDDDRLDRRQTAEEALIDLGPDALGLLPPTSSSMSAEVRDRLARVQNQLQRRFAERSVEATRVTLNGEMTLTEAFQAIRDQTGNDITTYEKFDDRVTANFDRVTFWEAFDQLLDQSRLTVDPFAGRRAVLTVVRRPERERARTGSACYRGMFRIEPTLVTAIRDLRNPTMAGLRVRLAVSWEPRTMPIALALPLNGISARDEHDRPIAVDGGRGTLNAAVESDISMIEMEVPLELPGRDAHRIALFQGSLEAMLPGRVETFEFNSLENTIDEQHRRAGVTVTLERLRQNDDIQEVHLRVKFDEATNALESHRGWIFKNEAYCVDANGMRVGFGATSPEPGGRHGPYRLPVCLRPAPFDVQIRLQDALLDTSPADPL